MIKTAKTYPTIGVTSELYALAKIRGEKIPANIKNSILKGEGRITGGVGEMAFIEYSGGTESIGRDVYQFDVLLNETLYEVKTKQRKDPPLSYYTCSVTCSNDEQECDYYVFTSTNFNEAWLLGYISNQRFKKIRRFMKKGEYDPSNGFICLADNWYVLVSDLDHIKGVL
jgi:hypothetical protein